MILAGKMRRNEVSRTLLATVFMTGTVFFSLPSTAQSLTDVLTHVYNSNPTLLAARATLEVTNEQVPQARAGWLPSLSLSESYSRTNTVTEDDGNGSTLSDTRTETLSLSQTLFSFENLARLKAADSAVFAGRYTLWQSEQTVLLGAVTAYLNVLRDKNIVDLRRNNVSVLEKQLESTRVQYDLRLRTEADLAQARSRLARARADFSAALGVYDRAISAFLQVVGFPPESLTTPEFTYTLPENEETTVILAGDQHPTVLTAMENLETAETDIETNQAARLPNLALAGSVSKTQTNNRSAQSTESATSTVSLTLTVPIFQTGIEFSNVRAARKTKKQRLLELDQARRTARDNAQQAWEDVVSAVERVKAFTVQVEAAKIALDGIAAELEVGRRTVIELLNAEQEYLDAQVNLATAKRDELVARFTLLERVGRLRADDIDLPVVIYDVEEDLKRNEWNFFSTEID